MGRKPLSDRLKFLNATTPPAPQVELRVTKSPTDIIRDANEFSDTVRLLLGELDAVRQQMELLKREVVFLRHANNTTSDERNHWRDKAMHYIRLNGEISTLTNAMLKLAQNSDSALKETALLVDEMPFPKPLVDRYLEPEPLPENVDDAFLGESCSIIQHTNGGAPMPDLNEIAKMAGRFAPTKEEALALSEEVTDSAA